MVAPQAEGPAPTDLRMIWPNETSDFTPWLAENLHLWGHAIGVDLKLVQNEAYGYGGYTDILAESAEHGRAVIENQLESSDNDHFVRLMGYAPDHKAGILSGWRPGSGNIIRGCWDGSKSQWLATGKSMRLKCAWFRAAVCIP